MPDLIQEQDKQAVSRQEETESAAAPAMPVKGQIPAELLKAFEQNYRSRRRGRWLKYATVSLAACLALFAWLPPSQRHERRGAVSRSIPARPAEQLQVAAPVAPVKKSPPAPAPLYAAKAAAPVAPAKQSPPAPAPVYAAKAAAPVAPAKQSPPAPAPTYALIAPQARKPLPAPSPQPAPRKPAVVAASATAPKLPSFIQGKSRDSAYSRQKSGWERYTDAKHEFRILKAGNRIKAVQVLASTPDTISESLLKSILKEISGKSGYQQTSQKDEHGFLVKRGSAGPGVRILIYTQKSRIRAFVISTS